MSLTRGPESNSPGLPALRRRHADIEVARGPAWLARIGMVAVGLAVAFLLKHAQPEGWMDWVTPGMIVGAGIVGGVPRRRRQSRVIEDVFGWAEPC